MWTGSRPRCIIDAISIRPAGKMTPAVRRRTVCISTRSSPSPARKLAPLNRGAKFTVYDPDLCRPDCTLTTPPRARAGIPEDQGRISLHRDLRPTESYMVICCGGVMVIHGGGVMVVCRISCRFMVIYSNVDYTAVYHSSSSFWLHDRQITSYTYPLHHLSNPISAGIYTTS